MAATNLATSQLWICHTMGLMRPSIPILVLLCAGASTLSCQESSNPLTDPREALRGLLGVTVETDHKGCGGIVDKELTKQDIEVKLRIAGIRVTQLPIAALGMTATCLPFEVAGKRMSTVMAFSLSLHQIVWLPPQPVRVSIATTWQSSHLLMCGAATKCDEFVRSQLKDHTDKFINDFLAMNPRQ